MIYPEIVVKAGQNLPVVKQAIGSSEALEKIQEAIEKGGEAKELYKGKTSWGTWLKEHTVDKIAEVFGGIWGTFKEFGEEQRDRYKKYGQPSAPSAPDVLPNEAYGCP